MDVIALVDGEHYPPVVKSAIAELRRQYDVKAAVFIGGTEKIKVDADIQSELGLPLYMSGNFLADIVSAVEKYRPQAAIDLSDEPVIGYDDRFMIASELSLHGVDYIGADFKFTALKFKRIFTKPSLSVIGTGKRIGKTAVSGYICRIVKECGLNPVAVTMGRGGPAKPELIDGTRISITAEYLLSQAKSGKHASSDHFEDALTSHVTTIGCRRCGGGMMGTPFYSVVEEGCTLAESLPNDYVILEGSGATFAPVETDRIVTVAGASQRPDYILKFFGRYRIKLADLVVITLCEEPMASQAKVDEIFTGVKSLNPDAMVVKTVFRPKPLADISGKRVFYATTAFEGSQERLNKYIAEEFDCEVVGCTNKLSNRPKLIEALSSAPRFDTLLVELKAAAVDVATEYALSRGLDVIYCDNIPVSLEGDLKKSVKELIASNLSSSPP